MNVVVNGDDVAEEQKEEGNWQGVLRNHFEELILCHIAAIPRIEIPIKS
jgi:hypothetical protein